MKKRILSLVMALALAIGLLPMSALAAGSNAAWPGFANYNEANNQVTSTTLPNSGKYTSEKWAYQLGTAAVYNAYYAGQPVIVDNFLYATGGGKLHQVDINTGVGTVINSSAGSPASYYDYLCYADGILIVATTNKLEAFSLTGESLGSVSGSFGYYHPIQYHDGYVICNGFVYRLSETENRITFTQVGDAAIGGSAFNWSSGAFVGNLFYVVDKTTVYAVDYRTNTVTDSYQFDASRTATSNVQGGAAYDVATGRLFWGTYTYNTQVHSIKINTDGTLDKSSYLSGDAGQKTVCTPVISGNRVYLAGQSGSISVLDASDLSLIYSVNIGGSKIQSTPIVSTVGGKTRVYVQGYDGHIYVMTDDGKTGTAEKLAVTKNYSGVQYPNAYEQIAMDSSGNLYCYNESGYLFCFEATACEVPSITSDLSTAQVKIAQKEAAEPLTISASVSDGGTLSYQWQSSTDHLTWTDIVGATQTSYTPDTATEATTYYRCVITNTKDGSSARAVSAAANILVKVLSTDTTLHVMVNGSNNPALGNPAKAVVGEDNILRVENRTSTVTNLWLGTVNDGTVTSFEILQGLASNLSLPSFTKKTSSNVYNGTAYNGYYRSTNYTLPIVAKAEVTAEDGITTATHYIVVDSTDAGSYTISANGFTSESAYWTNTGIAFSGIDQTVTLIPNVTDTIGTGSDRSAWTWSSSDTTVAKVNDNGVVTSIGGGTATITASCGRIIATCDVTSSASKHTTHTYVDHVCSVCGAAEPSALTAYFTLIDQNGKFAVSKDGSTELYQAELSVSDADTDGKITLNDAFLVLHANHSENGADDFVTENSLYITKLWGIESSSVGYYLNDVSANGLSTELKKDDVITAYFYQDTVDYSDVYTSINGQTPVSANNTVTYTVNGTAAGTTVIPKNATVKVYNNSNEEVDAMATTVDKDGTFTLTFADAGIYTIEVTGSCCYTGSVWDTTLSSYSPKEFTSAPIISSRMTVEVMPYASATVYVTVSDKSGSFVTGKNGDELYRLPVKVEDDVTNPDGQITLQEVGAAIHAQQHPDGVSAYSATTSWISKFWGDSSGSFGYYLNDVYLSGSGTKTGTNGRPFQDKLMGTVVEDGDTFNFFIYQSSNWSDKYTYFDPIAESAIAGTAKTLTAKSTGYQGASIPAGASIKVTDNHGAEQTALNTTVGNDGTFTITFPESGKYTVELRTNETAFFVPSRCTVYVSAGSSSSGTQDLVYISVVDPQGKTYCKKTGFTPNANETAYSLLQRTGLDIQATTDHQYGGVYVVSIEGLGEFDAGNQSGWMYKVNGTFPDYSASLYSVSSGDYVEWVYTRDLGNDVGGGSGGSAAVPADQAAADKVAELIAAIGTVTDASGDKIAAARTAYDALTAAQKKLVSNYALLTAAEQAYGQLTGAEGLPFTDVAGHWALDAIRYVYEQGLMTGTTTATFSPEKTITRGMIAAILYRLEGSPDVSGGEAFSDVDSGMYYGSAIQWAQANGIVEGYTSGRFGPDDAITREQLAVILYRYAAYKKLDVSASADLSGFADQDQISDYAADALSWANAAGLITGTKADTLSPKGSATRAQAAAILMRFLENTSA